MVVVQVVEGFGSSVDLHVLFLPIVKRLEPFLLPDLVEMLAETN